MFQKVGVVVRPRDDPRQVDSAALKSYQEFLTLWKDADPEIPIFKQAQAEYAKLQ